jgi:prophage DNA circulation protein
MNSIATYQKRLQNEVSVVEKEIQSHSQQIEALNKRLEGLKRAVQLVESEELAIAELLRTNLPDGNGNRPEMTTEPIATRQKTASSDEQGLSQKSARSGQNGRGKTTTMRMAHKAEERSGLKRSEMIAAVLKRRSKLGVRDLIAALDKEFGWQCTERNLTGHLYTNPKFVHTKADRSTNRPVTWSLK